MFAIKRH